MKKNRRGSSLLLATLICCLTCGSALAAQKKIELVIPGCIA